MKESIVTKQNSHSQVAACRQGFHCKVAVLASGEEFESPQIFIAI